MNNRRLFYKSTATNEWIICNMRKEELFRLDGSLTIKQVCRELSALDPGGRSNGEARTAQK